jgi:hypothetical protein
MLRSSVKRTLPTITGTLLLLGLLSLGETNAAQDRSRFGFKMIKPKVSEDLVYEDASIRIQFRTLEQLHFELTNKTDDAIEVHWSQSSIVDTRGEAHRVTHSGVRYIERNDAAPPTIIPPNAKITDLLHPSDYIDYDSDGGWKIRKLFDRPFNAYGDQTFAVFMVLKLGSATKTYNFVFKFDPERPTLISATIPQAQITQSQMGSAWPLMGTEAVVLCDGTKDSSRLFVRIFSRFYALNSAALGQMIDHQTVSSSPADEWAKPLPSGGRMSIDPLIKRATELCRN